MKLARHTYLIQASGCDHGGVELVLLRVHLGQEVMRRLAAEHDADDKLLGCQAGVGVRASADEKDAVACANGLQASCKG